MKKIFFAFFCIALSLNLYSQQYSSSEVALGNIVKRVYEQKPFKGVKIVHHSDTSYLISVVVYELDAFEDEHILNRTATHQARIDANLFIKNSTITSETIINTAEKAGPDSVKINSEIADFLKNTKQVWMDLLTSFDVAEGKQRVFVFLNTF